MNRTHVSVLFNVSVMIVRLSVSVSSAISWSLLFWPGCRKYLCFGFGTLVLAEPGDRAYRG